MDAAAKVLGIKQEVAYDLVRKGLLRSTTAGALGQRMSGADIELFQATYVSLANLARDGRRSPRALLAELPATPVCGPAIDGARQYFYRRSEVETQPSGGISYDWYAAVADGRERGQGSRYLERSRHWLTRQCDGINDRRRGD